MRRKSDAASSIASSNGADRDDSASSIASSNGDDAISIRSGKSRSPSLVGSDVSSFAGSEQSQINLIHGSELSSDPNRKAPEGIKRDANGISVYMEKAEKWAQVVRFLRSKSDGQQLNQLGSDTLNAESFYHVKELLSGSEEKPYFTHLDGILSSSADEEKSQFFQSAFQIVKNFSEGNPANTLPARNLVSQDVDHSERRRRTSLDSSADTADVTLVLQDSDQIQTTQISENFLKSLTIAALCYEEESGRFSIAHGLIQAAQKRNQLSKELPEAWLDASTKDDVDDKKWAMGLLSSLAKDSEFDIPPGAFEGKIRFNSLFKAEQELLQKDEDFQARNPEENSLEAIYDFSKNSYEQRIRNSDFKLIKSSNLEGEGEGNEDEDKKRYLLHHDRLSFESSVFGDEIESLKSNFSTSISTRAIANFKECGINNPDGSSLAIGGKCLFERRDLRNFEFRMNDAQYTKWDKLVQETHEEQKELLLKQNLTLLALQELVEKNPPPISESESSTTKGGRRSFIANRELAPDQSWQYLAELICAECKIEKHDSLAQRKEKQQLLGQNLKKLQKFLAPEESDELTPDSAAENQLNKREHNRIGSIVSKIQQQFLPIPSDQDDEEGNKLSSKQVSEIQEKFTEIFAQDSESQQGDQSNPAISSQKIYAATQNAFNLARLTAEKLEDQERKEVRMEFGVSDEVFNDYWKDKSSSWKSASGGKMISIPYRDNGITIDNSNKKDLIIFAGNHDDHYFKHLGNGCYLKIICANREKEYQIHDEKGQVVNKQLKEGDVEIDRAIYIIHPPTQKGGSLELKETIPFSDPKPWTISNFNPAKRFKTDPENFQTRLQNAMAKANNSNPSIYKTLAQQITQKAQNSDISVLSVYDGKVRSFKDYSFEKGAKDSSILQQQEKNQIHASWKSLDEGFLSPSQSFEDFKKSHGIVSLDENRKGILSLGLDEGGNEILVGFKDSAFAADSNGEFNLKKEGLVFFKLLEGRAQKITGSDGTDGPSPGYTECFDAFKKANFSLSFPSKIEEDSQESDNPSKIPREIRFTPREGSLSVQSNPDVLPVGKSVTLESSPFRNTERTCRPLGNLGGNSNSPDVPTTVPSQQLSATTLSPSLSRRDPSSPPSSSEGAGVREGSRRSSDSSR